MPGWHLVDLVARRARCRESSRRRAAWESSRTSLRDDERLLRVGLHDLRVDHLPGDVEERGHVDAVARFQHGSRRRALRGSRPRTHSWPSGTRASARSRRLKSSARRCFCARASDKMLGGLLRAVEVVATLEFAVFDHGVSGTRVRARELYETCQSSNDGMRRQ